VTTAKDGGGGMVGLTVAPMVKDACWPPPSMQIVEGLVPGGEDVASSATAGLVRDRMTKLHALVLLDVDTVGVTPGLGRDGVDGMARASSPPALTTPNRRTQASNCVPEACHV